MKCPADIQEIVVDLLTTALLRIRSAGWDGDAKLCAIEADHIHNLPTLLSNFSYDLLHFYFDVERQAYLDQMRSYMAVSGLPVDFRSFEKAWKSLDSVLAPSGAIDG